MRLRIPVLRLAVLLVAFFAPGRFFRTTDAQQRIPTDSLVNVAELDQVLRVGEQLEREQRWAEALAHYEEALRAHPDRADLEQRLVVARLHYEITRRYADRSYLESLGQLGEAEALDLYSEVLLKVESHYVEAPNWDWIVQNGALALDAALHEPAFLQQHGLTASVAVIDGHLDQVQRVLASRSVHTRHDARACAELVARMSQRDLGLAAPVVILEFTCAAGASLDEYSAFLTADQMQDVLSQIEGNFVGLGVELKAEKDSLLVVSVISSGPAESAGVLAGDRIVQVDGQSVHDISASTAADMLKGVEGSSVELGVVSAEGKYRAIQVQRRRVDVPSVDRLSMLDPHGIAYLRLTNFQKTTVRDVEAALWNLHRQGMRSLIIDLRGNPGGLLQASVEIVDEFISEGPIVSTRGRSMGEDYDYKAHYAGTWRVPLIVLIDGNSASASEIFAGAIRDHGRGTLVGTRSYGKGSVQGIFPLNSSRAGLRLTTAKFYSPSGQSISRRGVQPDVVVQTVAKPVVDGSSDLPADEDAVLQAALQIARQRLGGG